MTIPDYVEAGVAIVGGLVTVASIVASITPSESDNRWVARAINLLDALALNLNKRNPRKK